MNKVMVGWAVVILGLGLAGCSNSEQENLFEAQLCIDKISVPTIDPPTTTLTTAQRTALESSVDGCLAKLSGNSSQTYVLRCAGDFIKQGIAEGALINAIQNLDDGEQLTDPSIKTMNFFAFDTVAKVTTAVSNCVASESQSLKAFAGVAEISTNIKAVAPGGDINGLIDGYNPADLTNDEKIQLANSILNNQESLCNPDTGLFQGNEFCDNIPSSTANMSDADKQTFVDSWIANNNQANN